MAKTKKVQKKAVVKKAATKKAVKKAAPAKKSAVKKPATKKVAVVKKVAKKTATKKVVKTAAKKVAKKTATKPVAKKSVKKLTPKAVVKKATMPAAKVLTKPKTEVPVKKVTPVVSPKKTVSPSPKEVQNNTPLKSQVVMQPSNSNKDDARVRYSEEDLKEFEVLINDKLDKAKKELKYIRESLSRKNDESSDNSNSNLKLLEDGADTLEKESFSQLAARQMKFIQQLEFAFARIKNGTYGVCIETGNLIPKERLRAVPHTQHSIEAKLNRR